MFYFVRHGETDYSERGTKIYQGHGTNLAPLSETGIGQIRKAAKDIRLQEANLILCSSYTRAVQSAAILSKELGLEIRIETDLHEWVANDLYIYEDDHTAEKAYEEYVKNKGMPRKEISKNATNNGGLFLVDDQPPVLALVVAEEVLVVQAVPAIGELLPLPPADVFADAPALLLCE